MTTTEYEISYHTHNVYESPVTEALFAFLVSPCQDSSQAVRNLSFRNSLGEEIFKHQNPFGFEIQCVRSAKRFTDFGFWMKATVDKKWPGSRRAGFAAFQGFFHRLPRLPGWGYLHHD
jgi:hypothetical protein